MKLSRGVSLGSGVFLIIALGFLGGCGTSGSGTPTKTGTGAALGAGTGAAIGSAVGGEDGWWIGALTGAAVGGATGRAVGEADERRAAQDRGTTQERLPYGTKQGSTVQSPYSSYTVNIGGRTQGETVYDPNAEQYFVIP
jgi:hypothetical protein